MNKIKKELMEKFMEFYDRIKGRKDVKSRVSVLANPDNKKTMSVLSAGECDFVAIAYWAENAPEWGSMFRGLRELAEQKLEVNISKDGLGREQAIRFMGALSESKILSKLGVNVLGEAKEKK